MSAATAERPPVTAADEKRFVDLIGRKVLALDREVKRQAAEIVELRDLLEQGDRRRPGLLDDEEMARLREWIVTNPNRAQRLPTTGRRTLRRYLTGRARCSVLERLWEDMGLEHHALAEVLAG